MKRWVSLPMLRRKYSTVKPQHSKLQRSQDSPLLSSQKRKTPLRRATVKRRLRLSRKTSNTKTSGVRAATKGNVVSVINAAMIKSPNIGAAVTAMAANAAILPLPQLCRQQP